MNKKISKLKHFLFHKEHKILKNKKLFRFQSELAQFAITVKGSSFFGKTTEGIRPFLNQQLKVEGDPMSKPIKNHFSSYLKIVEERFKVLKTDIKEDDLKTSLKEFKDFFSKESIYVDDKQDFLLFDEITADILQQLQIVAVANGGVLTEKEFLKSFRNLREKSHNQK